jgi:hypothetical protein
MIVLFPFPHGMKESVNCEVYDCLCRPNEVVSLISNKLNNMLQGSLRPRSLWLGLLACLILSNDPNGVPLYTHNATN